MTGRDHTADVAAVLAAHWDYGPTKNYDGWECACGARISDDSTGALDDDMQAHVAAELLNSAPIAQALALAERTDHAEADADNAQADYDRRGERLWRLAALAGYVPVESDNDASAELVIAQALAAVEAVARVEALVATLKSEAEPYIYGGDRHDNASDTLFARADCRYMDAERIAAALRPEGGDR